MMDATRPGQRPIVVATGVDAIGSSMDNLHSYLEDLSIAIEIVIVFTESMSFWDDALDANISISREVFQYGDMDIIHVRSEDRSSFRMVWIVLCALFAL